MYHWINTIINNNITTNHQLIVRATVKIQTQLECGPMPNVMVALPNIGAALC